MEQLTRGMDSPSIIPGTRDGRKTSRHFLIEEIRNQVEVETYEGGYGEYEYWGSSGYDYRIGFEVKQPLATVDVHELDLDELPLILSYSHCDNGSECVIEVNLVSFSGGKATYSIELEN